MIFFLFRCFLFRFLHNKNALVQLYAIPKNICAAPSIYQYKVFLCIHNTLCTNIQLPNKKSIIFCILNIPYTLIHTVIPLSTHFVYTRAREHHFAQVSNNFITAFHYVFILNFHILNIGQTSTGCTGLLSCTAICASCIREFHIYFASGILKARIISNQMYRKRLYRWPRGRVYARLSEPRRLKLSLYRIYGRLIIILFL